jgi:hypothetical protein
MFVERRINRSSKVAEALRFQLAASANRAHMESLVLSNEEGLPMAIFGDPPDGEELAARSPDLVSGDTFWQGELSTDRGQKSVTVMRVPTDYGPIYLCAVGGLGRGLRWELLHSGLGVRRILS